MLVATILNLIYTKSTDINVLICANLKIVFYYFMESGYSGIPNYRYIKYRFDGIWEKHFLRNFVPN